MQLCRLLRHLAHLPLPGLRRRCEQFLAPMVEVLVGLTVLVPVLVPRSFRALVTLAPCSLVALAPVLTTLPVSIAMDGSVPAVVGRGGQHHTEDHGRPDVTSANTGGYGWTAHLSNDCLATWFAKPTRSRQTAVDVLIGTSALRGTAETRVLPDVTHLKKKMPGRAGGDGALQHRY